MEKRMRFLFFAFILCLLSMFKINPVSATEAILWFPLDEYQDPSCVFGNSCYTGHSGIDYAIPEGTSIYASISGTVTHVTENVTEQGASLDYGNYVTIETGTYKVYLGHMLGDSIVVEENQQVSAGDFIGLSSNTGDTLPIGGGYHVHVELRYNGVSVDPELYWTTDPPRKADGSPYATLFSTAKNTAFSYYNRSNKRTDKCLKVKESPGSLLFTADNGVHWWGYNEDVTPDQRLHQLSDNTYLTLLVQDYTGDCDGAIVYDEWGGANRAYVVQCEQWTGWLSRNGPQGAVNQPTPQYCGAPITNVYGRGNKWIQDFQNCRVVYQPDDGSCMGNSYVNVKDYPNGWAPGEMADHTWDATISYGIAEKYEARGASSRLGYPVTGVTEDRVGHFIQYFEKKEGGQQRRVGYSPSTAQFFSLNALHYQYVVGGTETLSTAINSSDSDVYANEDYDLDGDGFTPNEGDCDDASANLYPDAPEVIGDGIDNDCDQEIDEADPESIVGIPDGTLIHGDASASIYVMDNGYKRGVPNEETFEDCGYIWGSYCLYSQAMVDAIPEGELWTLGDCVPDGTLIHGNASASIYVMDAGYKRGIPNEETFVACGYIWGGYATYQQAAVDAIPEGSLWTLADCFSYTSVDLSSQASVAYSDLGSKPYSYTDPATGNFYTVFNGQDRIIYELAFNGSTWSSTWLSYMAWVPYAQAGTSPMGFVDPNTGYRYVVFMGSDACPWLFKYNNSYWTSIGLCYQVWVPYADLNSEPYGYADPITGYIHVLFTGNDRNIYEFRYNGSYWSVTNLSYQVWVPYAQAGTSPMGFVDPNTGYRYVVFTAETGDIWMFTWNWSYWSSINLSAQDWVNYADLSSSPYGYVDTSTGRIYVVFNGIDQLIYELAFNGSYWDATVISVQDSAPYSEPGTGPTAYLDQLTNERIVLFMGDNHRVQQFVNNGSSWISTDLSSQASVPYGASGTSVSGCYDDIDGTRYAVFNGDNARINMLRYGP